MNINERYEIEHKSFTDGATMMRDLMICTLIGMQNDCISYETEEAKAYQKAIGLIEKFHGEYAKPIKGI